MKNIVKLSCNFSRIAPGKINITMTSHPTNPNVAKNSENGQILRPKLWEEIKVYESYTPVLIENHNTSQASGYLNQINIWFDFDRHQDDRTGIIIYMNLVNIQGILRWYKKSGYDCDIVINEINKTIEILEARFNNDDSIKIEELQNFRVLLSKISQAIQGLRLSSCGIINPFGFNAHYRISSQDLYCQKDRRKIVERLLQLKVLQDQFGKLPISEIIIADCQSVEDIRILKGLCYNSGIQYKIPIVPLIETDFGDRFLRKIVAQDIEKIMLAGSDTIQRDTYISALLIKLKLQLQILEDKQNREIIFFQGTGSTVNRNGNMFRSRMGTIIQGIQYERTIQGKQRQQFMTDKEYHIRTLRDLAQGERCSAEDAEVAIPILTRIYKEVSMFQIVQQKEPYFSQKYNKKTVYQLLVNNSHVGSRCIKPKDPITFTVKSQRAIPQSYLNLITGFHPQLLYWDFLTDKTKFLIKKNLQNTIIQDMLNQYTVISSISCAKAAENYLKCKNTLQKLKKGRYELRLFLEDIKKVSVEDSTKQRLLLHMSKQQIIKYAFNLEDCKTQEVLEAYNSFDRKRVKGDECFKDQIRKSKLFQRTGAGFSTSKLYQNQLSIDSKTNNQRAMEIEEIGSWI